MWLQRIDVTRQKFVAVVVAAVLVVVAAGAIAACDGRRAATRTARYPGAPVVLISIDTLRADRLPVYGYRAGATPAINAFAREAVVFEDLYSHAPLTLPSHASLLTGLLPLHHGVRDNIGYTLAERSRTLATRFKGAGYATGGAVSAYVLRHQTGIAAGFDFFDDRIPIAGDGESLSDTRRDGRLTVDALAGWIDLQAGRRVFAFLHLYEPHTPYDPPPSHRMADPYNGEIAYADELVGRLFDRLKGRGLFDRAVIALVSDHGEGLNDHGEAEHGIFLYREALHVPGILRLPAAAAGGRHVSGTLGEVDVAATLLDLAGLPIDGMDGGSVVPELGATHMADRTVYSETFYPRLHFGLSDLAAATEGRYRFIRAPRSELFDLANDPGERTNLAAGGNASTAAALNAWIARTTAGSATADPADVPSDVRDRLRALGYIGSTRTPIAAAGPLRDPKDGIAAVEALKRAQALSNQGRNRDAIAGLEQLVMTEPGMLDAWESLAKARIRDGRTAGGIAAFGKVLELEPLKPETHLALARIHALEGQPARARRHAELALARDPAAANEILASLAMDEGRLGDASAFARRSVKADPSRYMSHFLLGVIAQRQGQCHEAIDDFARAIDAKRAEPNTVVRNLHSGMADCLARTGRQADAEREFQAELSAIPSSPEGRVGLATLYRSQGRDQEARATLAGLVTSRPEPSAESYWTVVHTFMVLGDTVSAREWAARARAIFPRDPRFR